MVLALVAVAAVAIVVLLVVAARLRRPPDTVASFRRQIDALSSEARRPVVDQVTQIERDPEPTPDPAADVDPDDDGEDRGGARTDGS